jgi:hypothetical protein
MISLNVIFSRLGIFAFDRLGRQLSIVVLSRLGRYVLLSFFLGWDDNSDHGLFLKDSLSVFLECLLDQVKAEHGASKNSSLKLLFLIYYCPLYPS